MKQFTKVAAALVALAVLSSCAATTTLISKRKLDTQTKMSNTVFLDPVGGDKRSVYLQIRNTSDKPDFQIEGLVRQQLQQRGYRLENDPDRAHYWLQANVLSVGKMDPTAAQQSLNGGYGGGLAGAAGAYVLGARTGRGIVGGGLAGQAIEVVTGALVKDVTFAAITDLQISERVKGQVQRSSNHNLAQGNSGGSTQSYSDTSNRKRYQTRVVSTANKANLKWEEALPSLIDGLGNSVAGIF